MDKALLAVLAASAALASLPAWGDARQDVVTGVTRCAVLTDDRQWLDCFYGAAQPMRAKLGLPPAPQAQIKLLEDQPKPMGLPPAMVVRAAVHSGPPPAPRHSSIFDIFGGGDVINNGLVRSYRVSRDGFVITLADGQVWKQTSDDATKYPVNWTQSPSSMRVTISQGALHTFNLVVGEETLHHKVTRIH